MQLAEKADSYDAFSWFYRKHWCSHYHGWAVQLLERLLLRQLPSGARVLDLCCGVGTISAELCRRGFHVTGVDASAEMIRFARQDVPRAEFVHADAREFRKSAAFDAALSTFDSLNHILSSEDLLRVFRNVRQSLAPGGAFVFDLNLEEAYRTGWSGTCTVVEDDNAFFVRGDYDPERHIGRTCITTFRFEREWRRSDTTLFQRCYSVAEVLEALRAAGFHEARAFDPASELALDGPPARGRAAFRAVAA